MPPTSAQKNALAVGGRHNRLKRLWREGRCALGTIATIPSVQTLQIMARAGLDWMLIDLEHGPIDAASAQAMIAAGQGTSLVPLVRVTETSVRAAKLPLDLGAHGICFPMTTVEDAEAAVRAVRYPPRGERFWGPFCAPPCWGLSMQDYLAVADDEVLAISTLEHVDVVPEIREIALTPGLDLLCIGPGDFATSMGLKGRPEHPDAQAAMALVERAVLDSPVLLGGAAFSAADATAKIARGYRLLALGFDWSLFDRGIAAALDGIKR